MSEITRNGVIFDNHVSIRGGEKVRYHVSLSSFNQKGVLITSDYAKYSGYTSLEINLSEKIKTDIDIDLLKRTPSSYLGSCRYKLPEISEGKETYEKIFEILNELDIKYFFYIGGNDSMDTIKKLSLIHISEPTRH